MRICIINAYHYAFQAQMKQEIEGTGNSLGVWCMKLINPDCFLGAEFVYLLHEMVQVNNNLKLLKKLIFCTISNAYIRANTHYNNMNMHYNNTYSCEYALLPKVCTLFFRFPSCYWLLKMKTALGPNISPSGLAAGSIIFLLIPTF